MEPVSDLVFVFENAVHAFGHAVLVAMVVFSHADRQSAIEQQVDVVVAAILDATIGMMNRLITIRQLPEGHFDGAQRAGGFQVFMEMPSDDLPRIGIGYQGQISETTANPEIGQIADPGLMGARENSFDKAIGINSQMVARIRGFPGFSTRFYQQTMSTHKIEQPVATNRDTLLRQFILNQNMELSTAYLRLQTAFTLNQT